MTNAIESAKLDMYDMLGIVKTHTAHRKSFEIFESTLEAYLELLRQDHEALHHTARARFEDTRKLEAANQELSAGLSKANENLTQAAIISRDSIASLEFRLAKMTEERDSIQLRLHAVDHAYSEQQSRAGTSGQVSGDRASCATTDAKTMALLGAVVDVQRITTDWAVNGLRAKTAIHAVSAVVNGKPSVLQAMKDFEKPATCMHSFFAIGGDQMKCTFCGVGK